MENTGNIPASKNIDYLVSDIQETRSRICNAFIITIATIAVPALTASLYRIVEVGWQPVMGVHIFIAVTLWSILCFRKRIPFHYQASYIIIVFLILGLGGILQFGLVAGGAAFIIASSPIATLFFGGRKGISTLLMAFCGAIAIGLLTIFGKLHYGFDLEAYAAAPSSWLTSIFGWFLASTALTVSLHVFNKNLINALKISRQYQKSLFNHQLDLEKIIEERNRSNLKLHKALEEIKTLRGILPICAYCHRIRDDNGAWSLIEDYLSSHSEAKLTHGICPKCTNKVRAENGL